MCSASLQGVLQRGCVVLRQSGKTKIKAVAIFHLAAHYRNVCGNIVDVVCLPAFQLSETML